MVNESIQDSDYNEKKFDQGKRRWNLFPFGSAEEIVKILEFGAEKYSANSWQELPNAEERYFEACMRHMVAIQKGEDVDQESGMPHLAHAGCNILFLLHFLKEKHDVKS